MHSRFSRPFAFRPTSLYEEMASKMMTLCCALNQWQHWFKRNSNNRKKLQKHSSSLRFLPRRGHYKEWGDYCMCLQYSTRTNQGCSKNISQWNHALCLLSRVNLKKHFCQNFPRDSTLHFYHWGSRCQLVYLGEKILVPVPVESCHWKLSLTFAGSNF